MEGDISFLMAGSSYILNVLNLKLMFNRALVKRGQVVKCLERCFDKSNIFTSFEKQIRVKLNFFGCFIPIFNYFNLNRV